MGDGTTAGTAMGVASPDAAYAGEEEERETPKAAREDVCHRKLRRQPGNEVGSSDVISSNSSSSLFLCKRRGDGEEDRIVVGFGEPSVTNASAIVVAPPLLSSARTYCRKSVAIERREIMVSFLGGWSTWWI